METMNEFATCIECGDAHEDGAYIAPCGTDGPEDCVERASCGSSVIEHSHEHADPYYIFDEFEDATGWAERQIAGPFATAEDAAAALRDVAYPYSFTYGPATVVGETFIATENTR